MKKIFVIKAIIICFISLSHYAVQAQKITWGEVYTLKDGVISGSTLSLKNDAWKCKVTAGTGRGFNMKFLLKSLFFNKELKFVTEEDMKSTSLKEEMKKTSKSRTGDISKDLYSIFVANFKDAAQKKTLYEDGMNIFDISYPFPASLKTNITKDSNLILADIQEEKNNNKIKYTTFNKNYEVKEGNIQLPSNYEQIEIIDALIHNETQIQIILKYGKKDDKVLLLSYNIQKQKLETTELPLAKALAYKGITNNQNLYILSVEPSEKKHHSSKLKISIYNTDGKFIKEQLNTFSNDFTNTAKSDDGMVNFKDWEFSNDVTINDYGQMVVNGEYHRMSEVQSSSGSFQPTNDSRTGRITMQYKDNTRNISTGMYIHEYSSTYLFLIDINSLNMKNFVIRKNQSNMISTYLSTQSFSNGKDFYIFHNDHKKNVNLAPNKSPQRYDLNNSALRVHKLTPDGIFEEKVLVTEQEDKKMKEAVINLKSIFYHKKDKSFYAPAFKDSSMGIMRIDIQ